jgi:hypothetical protein
MVKKLDSKVKWLLVAVISCIALVLGLRFSGISDRQARSLVASAKTGERSSLVKLELASRLSSHPESIINQLTEEYLAQDRPAFASKTLRRLPIERVGERVTHIQLASGDLRGAEQTLRQFSRKVGAQKAMTLQARLLLEQGRGDQAIHSAKSSGDDYCLALVLAAAGRTPELNGLAAQKPSERVKRVISASSSNLALAQLLHAEGLLNSSQRLLKNISPPSVGLYKLRTELHAVLANKNDRYGLMALELERLIQLDPGNIEAHRVLADCYDRLKRTDDADKQRRLANSLSSKY